MPFNFPATDVGSELGVNTMGRTFLRAIIMASIILGAALVFANAGRADDPPIITEFDYMNPIDNYFVFFGWVEDEYPESCFVIFGDCLDGYYTSVNDDGSFYLVIQLQPWETGLASVVAYDYLYSESNEAFTYVYY